MALLYHYSTIASCQENQSLSGQCKPGLLRAGYVNAQANDKFTPTPEDPGFALTGGIKDVSHMQRLGRQSGAPLPIVDIVLQHMQQVKDMGGGNLDWSSLALAVRKEAGLPLSHLQ